MMTTTTTTKPVEQPKNINLLKTLNPNLIQIKLVNNNLSNDNLRLSGNLINSSNSSNDDTSPSNSTNNTSMRNYSRSNHRSTGSGTSGGIQSKLAISLGSFSDIIRKTTAVSTADSEVAVMRRSRGDDHSSNTTADDSRRINVTDDDTDKAARSGNEGEFSESSATTATINKQHSTSNISGKLCSPPPLGGRDIEHHHATSHLRRFELEI